MKYTTNLRDLQGRFFSFQIDCYMSQQLISVALPLPIHKCFTYAVPNELDSSQLIGSRVLVPFGKQTLTGMVVNEPPDTSMHDIKSIIEVLDDTPIFNNTMLAFLKWIAEYYFASYGETIKAALPAGMSPHSIVRVAIKQHLTKAELETLKKRAPKRAELYEYLQQRQGEVSVGILQKHSKSTSISEQLETLESSGLISIHTTIEHEAKPKMQKAVMIDDTLLSDQQQFRSILDELDKKAPKQALVLSHLYLHAKQLNEPCLVTTLTEQLHINDAALTALIKKKYVHSMTIEVHRNYEATHTSLAKTNESLHELSHEQSHALHKIQEALNAQTAKTFLLHGVTGSGKTLVYLHAIKHTIAQQKNALILVPEIALTPQLIDRFRAVFDDNIAVLHSKMSVGQRFDQWRKILRHEVNIVIGARSALFAPIDNLGIIIVDEEHEASYKQQDPAPRYQARDCAIIRAAMEKAVVVLGSATPSMESYFNAQMGKYHLLEITNRADNAQLPNISLLSLPDLRKKNLTTQGFANQLLDLIAQKIQDKQGVILLHNKRGFASRIECPDCGHIPQCKNCSVSLTYHKKTQNLRCHYCGYATEPPRACTVCGSLDIQEPGTGTQKIEEILHEILKNRGITPTISRMDHDSTTQRGAHRKILQDFNEKKTDIIVGTQMVAKGLDFPHVTLVGVINADIALFLPDFRASERTYQLLTQVAGRAGRSGDLRGTVIIQTAHPEHQALFATQAGAYHHFYSDELQLRKQALYPPFTRFIVIEFTSPDQQLCHDHAHHFASFIPRGHQDFFHIGPTTPLIERIRSLYRRIIIIKNIKILDPTGEHIRSTIKQAYAAYNHKYAHRHVHITIDIDSYTML